VFRSGDGAGSWSVRNTGLANTSVFALAIDRVTPTTLYAGMSGEPGVFKTEDRGGGWGTRNLGLPPNSVLAVAIDPVTHTTLYSGTFGGGVF
jgi:hypothetical protein